VGHPPVPYANLTNPQTLNLYAMVRDNPESFADLDGHMAFPGECWMGDAGCGVGQKSTTGNDDQKNQNQPQDQPKPDPNAPKPDPNKPILWPKDRPLPDDPTKLGPDWKKNPNYHHPYGEEYVNDKTGEKLEWNKGRPGYWGPKADRGKDGWHYTPPGGVRGKQIDPGKTLKAATTVGFWATVAVVTARVATAIGEALAGGGEAIP